ncbi:hypothetical protein UMM65_02900 [Aureibaculum sp. 2210JD6-5]|uniref:hypothetical protein n=1 Tax=Aureibaculum sp. 2210JD6-5 TaxID=3103957 RepID=UPI002AADCE1C|nr:hypothetical protein [Aureibaculum sp. 2210JD6-5]MDY7394175.1 hypothetical protein [Aureibaculum sp. 2210JD6-5]
MMIKIKKWLFPILFILCVKGFSQIELRRNPYIKSSIVFKNKDSISGFVKLNGSAFDIRFKDSIKQKKSKKIKYKEVEKIMTLVDSLNPREFYYKKTDQTKFFYFIELIHNDFISIYVNSSDRLNLFYYDSGMDRRSANEFMSEMRSENNFLNLLSPDQFGLVFFNSYNNFFNISSGGFNLEFERIDFFLHKEGQDKLVLVGVTGSPFSKNFKKNSFKIFRRLPKIGRKIKGKGIKIKEFT